MLAAGAIVTLQSHSYRLAAPLAGSSYGLVWRADTLPAGPPVALKLVNRQQMDKAAPAQRQRWIDGARVEADFLRQLAPWDGRHIVRLLDSGQHAGLPVLALELMEENLAQAVARRRAAGLAPDAAQALAWMAQLNQALAKVHQYGRRHLDVKPSNVLLADGGAQLKLADFGTSRADSDRAPHVYAGTPNWQAPEQVWTAGRAASGAGAVSSADKVISAGEALYSTSTATDYFALGALFYYLVTGGVALRFCADAAHDWRQRHDGAQRPLAADPAADTAAGPARAPLSTLSTPASPATARPTLRAHEADNFVRHCASLPTRAAGQAALALLRALLAPNPAARPPHAVAIARMLAAAREATPAGPARRASTQPAVHPLAPSRAALRLPSASSAPSTPTPAWRTPSWSMA